MSCLPVDLPRGKSMLLPTGKCGTSLAWCWTFLASKVGSFLASADKVCLVAEEQRQPAEEPRRREDDDGFHSSDRVVWGSAMLFPSSSYTMDKRKRTMGLGK